MVSMTVMDNGMVKSLTELIAHLQAIYDEHGEMVVIDMTTKYERGFTEVTGVADGRPRWVATGALDLKLRVGLRSTAEI